MLFDYTWYKPKIKYRPEERFYQVGKQLWAGVYPGDVNPRVERQKLNWLIDHGVDHFINLMELKETDWCGKQFRSYMETMSALAAKRKIHVVMQRFPIKDMKLPTRKKMTKILDSIDAAIANGHTVYVHCWGGHGRTGTVVGCWLARHGIAQGYNAIDMLADLRRNEPTKKPSPQTDEQTRMVVKWRPGW
ncbi:MAG: dual specificity protein phosphatase family protein [Syntrophomonas sp.]